MELHLWPGIRKVRVRKPFFSNGADIESYAMENGHVSRRALHECHRPLFMLMLVEARKEGERVPLQFFVLLA